MTRTDAYLAVDARLPDGAGSPVGVRVPDDALLPDDVGPGPRVVAGAFRLAGADWPEDHETWRRHLAERLPGTAISVKNDAYAALRLGDPTGTGVVVTVGTGPAVAARSSDGAEEHSGMFVLHDLGGSGLGNSAIRAVVAEWMGLGPRTRLTPMLLERFGVADGGELRHLETRREGSMRPRERIALARMVLAIADGSDAVATEIVQAQARAFADIADWVARRCGCPLESGALPVLLAGSVVTSEHPAMRDALRAELARRAPDAVVRVCDAPPIDGVILDALVEGGVVLTPAVAARVAAGHPEDFTRT